MESIKSAIASALLEEFGPGSILELETGDRCIKILLPVSDDHVVYVRPDDHERNFLCHYAHVEDLKACEGGASAEIRAWMQQNVAQLPLRIKGSLRKFVPVTMWYVKQAAERIELMKGLDGKRLSPKLETFHEARARLYNCPEPKHPGDTWTAPV